MRFMMIMVMIMVMVMVMIMMLNYSPFPFLPNCINRSSPAWPCNTSANPCPPRVKQSDPWPDTQVGEISLKCALKRMANPSAMWYLRVLHTAPARLGSEGVKRARGSQMPPDVASSRKHARVALPVVASCSIASSKVALVVEGEVYAPGFAARVGVAYVERMAVKVNKTCTSVVGGEERSEVGDCKINFVEGAEDTDSVMPYIISSTVANTSLGSFILRPDGLYATLICIM